MNYKSSRKGFKIRSLTNVQREETLLANDPNDIKR